MVYISHAIYEVVHESPDAWSRAQRESDGARPGVVWLKAQVSVAMKGPHVHRWLKGLDSMLRS